ncbi:hypothetical protein FDECE_10604 [Fusarium decemcellulare]|nr:hypothetical protein FDECE_10604 [Fusarium decemcellulare]
MDHSQPIARQAPAAVLQLRHAAPAAIIAIAIVLAIVSLLVSVLRQVLEQRLIQRRGWFLATIHPPSSPPSSSSSKRTTQYERSDFQVRPISAAEIEARQLLFTDPAPSGERLPLRDPNMRGSLYDTFQIPKPHEPRLNHARSMMELNGVYPSRGVDEKGAANKAKTIHWHGVNSLNTAWAWMS